MARAIRVHRLDLTDDGSGPVRVEIHALLTDDDPVSGAMGLDVRPVVKRTALPRAAWNALLSTLRRRADDDWPDNVLPFPVAKDT